LEKKQQKFKDLKNINKNLEIFKKDKRKHEIKKKNLKLQVKTNINK